MSREDSAFNEAMDAVQNLSKINSIMHEFADGQLTREQCKQRLITECSVVNVNLDTLLSAYSPSTFN